MATSLKSTVKVSVSGTLTSSGDAISNPSAPFAKAISTEFANGTSNAQADKAYAKAGSLAASGTETLDMGTSGGMLDVIGAAFEPVEVVTVMIVNDATSLSDLIVGVAAAEPFLGPMLGTAPTQTLKPGDVLFWHRPTGFVVANNTNDKLKITASAGTGAATYAKEILGRSA